ncbi:MAG: cytochrome P450 [Armatimonadota bacterium]|nr:cytochrome P450 [Armatimonadota bacterium]
MNSVTSSSQREQPRLVFAFHGGDWPCPGTGQQLYREEAIFRETVQRCSRAVEDNLGFSLSDFFTGQQGAPADSLERNEQRNIVLSAVLELALCDLWRSKGVEPDAILGCCGGEFAAGYAAGALSLEESVAVMCSAAYLVTRRPAPGHFVWLDLNFDRALHLGRMSRVRLDVITDVSPLESLAYCASTDLAELERFLAEKGLSYRVMPTEWGYHTPGTNVLSEIAEKLYKPQPRPLSLPLYSSVTGGLIYPGTVLSADYWYSATVNPVLFGHATCAALADDYNVILNVCADPTLRRGIEQSATMLNKHILILDTMRRGKPERVTWKESIQSLSASGLLQARSGRAGPEEDLGPGRRSAADSINSDAINLLRPDVVRNPYPYYAVLRRSGSVHFLPRHGFWLVLDYDDVLYALKHPQLFSSVRPTVEFDPLLTEADPPAHTRVRRILTPYFSAQLVQSLEGYVRECAVKLLSQGDRTAELDFIKDFAEPLTEQTMGRLLGFSEDETEDLRRCLSPHKQRLGNPRFHMMVQVLEEWLRQYVERQRECPGENLGSWLLQGQAEAALAPQEVVTLLKLLWIAGIDTVSRLIPMSALLLLQQPLIRGEVQRDLRLLPSFIEEALRLEPPELMANRATREEVEVAGVKIPAGAKVRLCIAAANRDPQHFTDPDTLSLQRKPNHHLSFIAGPHFCLGAQLARLEARIALETLLTQWPHFSPARPLHTMTYDRSFFHRSLQHLYITAN